MYLSISILGSQADDLGWLLHKHPDRWQHKALNFGQAHIFYPIVESDQSTAVLHLDIDTTKEMRRDRHQDTRQKTGRRGSSFVISDGRHFGSACHLFAHACFVNLIHHQ